MKSLVNVKFCDFESAIKCDDFIYNRFDKQKNREFAIIEVSDSRSTQYIQIMLDDKIATLGVWLLELSRKQLSFICKFIFKNFKNITTILAPFTNVGVGFFIKKNHYDLKLTGPTLIADTMRKKHLREIEKQRRRLVELLGLERFENYKSEDCPDSVMNFYFFNKRNNMGVDYKLDTKTYFDKYNVSDIYALYYGNRIVSVLLSCEQCSKVYIENLTFDKELSRCSPGKLIYMSYINILIQKGFLRLYLGGGDYEYKTYFGSEKKERFICTIKRHRVMHFFMYIKRFIKRLLKIFCKEK